MKATSRVIILPVVVGLISLFSVISKADDVCPTPESIYADCRDAQCSFTAAGRWTTYKKNIPADSIDKIVEGNKLKNNLFQLHWVDFYAHHRKPILRCVYNAKDSSISQMIFLKNETKTKLSTDIQLTKWAARSDSPGWYRCHSHNVSDCPFVTIEPDSDQ